MANSAPLLHHRLMNQQILQFPHRQDGTINYTVLGNMLTATILGEALEVSFVDQEYGKPSHQLLNDEESNWVFHYKENDVTVYRKKRPNSKSHCFLGRGVIDVPLSKVVDYLHKFHSRLEWDNFLTQIEICKIISESDWLYYMAHEASQCLFTSRRDFFLYCRSGYVDNRYVQTSISIEDKDYPHRPPYIRGEIMEGSGWIIEKNKDSECSTLVTYVANMDLKDLPANVMDKVLKRQPMAIHHIRKKLTNHIRLFDNSITTSVTSDIEYSLPDADRFEDTVPVSHYTNRDSINNSVEVDEESAMYPWVKVNKKVREKKRQAIRTRQPITKGDAITHSSDTHSTTSPHKEETPLVKTRSSSLSDKAVSNNDCKSEDNGQNDIQQNDIQQNNTNGTDGFPSFTTWSKQ